MSIFSLRRFIVIFLTLGFLLLAFQNCSPQGFEVNSSLSGVNNISDLSGSGGSQTPAPIEPATPYDENGLEKIANNSLLLNLKPKQIFQRQAESNSAAMKIELTPYNSAVQWITVAVTQGTQAILKKTYAFQDVVNSSGKLQISFPLKAGGWYRLQVLQVIGQTAYVSTHEQFGVGDIYVIAGQSNAANHAETRTQSKNSLVVMYDPESGTWSPCQDPLPFASVFSNLIGAGVKGQGSTWPELGDLLANEEQVPIGFLNTAIGGSPLSLWLPGAAPYNVPYNMQNVAKNYYLYQRLLTASQRLIKESNGFKMILWHQGESDLENCNLSNTALCDSVLYSQRFLKLKSSLDTDLQKNIQWMVAQTSFFPANAAAYLNGSPCSGIQNLYKNSATFLISSQRGLWGTNNIVQGPSSDDLLDSYRFTGQFGACVHFSYKGQSEMSKRWYAAIVQAR